MDAVPNRFMFDTNALNKICANFVDEVLIYLSKHNGFEYYFSEIQCQESAANISKVTDGIDPCLVERQRAELALNLLRVIPKLQTQYCGKFATLWPGGWLLDGTFDILPDSEGAASEMFSDILNGNVEQYYNDAMIAMTAIVKGCVCVTDDKRLFNKINKHFSDRAIRYENFMPLMPDYLSCYATSL
ncbi:MAG: hypothetical protein VB078_00230 [Clostridiaceae bacterium]|nr:hypothetical protein [Clostridiaceae bacterium]